MLLNSSEFLCIIATISLTIRLQTESIAFTTSPTLMSIIDFFELSFKVTKLSAAKQFLIRDGSKL